MSNLADEVARASAETARRSGSVPVQVLSLTIQLVAAWRASKDSDYKIAANKLTELNLVFKDDPVVCVSSKLGPIASARLETALKKEGIESFGLARGLVGVRKRDVERVSEIAEKAGVKLPSLSFSEKDLEAAAQEAEKMARETQEKSLPETAAAVRGTQADGSREAAPPPGEELYEPNEEDGGFNPPISVQEGAANRVARALGELGQELDGLDKREPSR